MEREEESAVDLGLDDPFFLFSSLTGSMIEHGGSPASLGGVGTKSKINPRSNFELSLPITNPTCSISPNREFRGEFEDYWGRRVEERKER